MWLVEGLRNDLGVLRAYIRKNWRRWGREFWKGFTCQWGDNARYPKFLREPEKTKVQTQVKLFGAALDWATFKEGETPNLMIFSTGGHTEHAAPLVREWPPLPVPGQEFYWPENEPNPYDPDWAKRLGVDLSKPTFDFEAHTCTGDDSCIFCPPKVESSDLPLEQQADRILSLKSHGGPLNVEWKAQAISPHTVSILMGREHLCARGEPHQGLCVPLHITLGEE